MGRVPQLGHAWDNHRWGPSVAWPGIIEGSRSYRLGRTTNHAANEPRTGPNTAKHTHRHAKTPHRPPDRRTWNPPTGGVPRVGSSRPPPTRHFGRRPRTTSPLELGRRHLISVTEKRRVRPYTASLLTIRTTADQVTPASGSCLLTELEFHPWNYSDNLKGSKPSRVVQPTCPGRAITDGTPRAVATRCHGWLVTSC